GGGDEALPFLLRLPWPSPTLIPFSPTSYPPPLLLIPSHCLLRCRAATDASSDWFRPPPATRPMEGECLPGTRINATEESTDQGSNGNMKKTQVVVSGPGELLGQRFRRAAAADDLPWLFPGVTAGDRPQAPV
ncbi:unnamed protein product, partial [Musa textilis]